MFRLYWRGHNIRPALHRLIIPSSLCQTSGFTMVKRSITTLELLFSLDANSLSRRFEAIGQTWTIGSTPWSHYVTLITSMQFIGKSSGDEVKYELGRMSRRKVRIAYYRIFIPTTWLRTACCSQWYPSSWILLWMNRVSYAHLGQAMTGRLLEFRSFDTSLATLLLSSFLQ